MCLQTLLPRSSSAEWVAAPTKAIKLIDYEYSGVNAVAYDIANHWCGRSHVQPQLPLQQALAPVHR